MPASVGEQVGPTDRTYRVTRCQSGYDARRAHRPQARADPADPRRRAASGSSPRPPSWSARRPTRRSASDEVMRRAGLGRTIFYRHFDDLGDLLLPRGARGGRRALRGPAGARRCAHRRRAGRGPARDRAGRRRLRAPRAAAARDGRGGRRRRAGQRRATGRCASASTTWSSEALRRVWPATTAPPADFAETARALNRHERELPASTRSAASRASRPRSRSRP